MDDKLFAQLNDYLDGELEGSERTEFEARIQRDPELRRELDALRDLLHSARALPKTVEPERDLWSGIEHAIQRDEDPRGSVVRFGGRRRVASPGSWWPMAVAAAAVITFFLGARYLDTMEPEPPVHKITVVPETDDELDEVRAEYAEARGELARLLEERREYLPADTLEVVEANLGIIEDAVVDINRALAEYPEDPKLRGLLREAYRREVQVLQQAVQLPDETT